MTKEELAALLNGREYSLGVTDEEWSHAMGLACEMAANGSKLGASIIIIKAIREAVDQEREACAQLFDDHPHAEMFRREIADSIRSRSEPHPPWCSGGCCMGDAFDSAEFRRLCQAYRWTREIDGPEIVKAFEDLQDFCRKAVEQGKG